MFGPGRARGEGTARLGHAGLGVRRRGSRPAAARPPLLCPRAPAARPPGAPCPRPRPRPASPPGHVPRRGRPLAGGAGAGGRGGGPGLPWEPAAAAATAGPAPAPAPAAARAAPWGGERRRGRAGDGRCPAASAWRTASRATAACTTRPRCSSSATVRGAAGRAGGRGGGARPRARPAAGEAAQSCRGGARFPPPRAHCAGPRAAPRSRPPAAGSGQCAPGGGSRGDGERTGRAGAGRPGRPGLLGRVAFCLQTRVCLEVCGWRTRQTAHLIIKRSCADVRGGCCRWTLRIHSVLLG